MTSVKLSRRATRIVNALGGEFIDDIQHPNLASVMRTVLDKIIGRDVARTFWQQLDARNFIQPVPCLLWLPFRNSYPFSTPDTRDALLVNGPACLMQQRSNSRYP